jgi:hypothetical protein
MTVPARPWINVRRLAVCLGVCCTMSAWAVPEAPSAAGSVATPYDTQVADSSAAKHDAAQSTSVAPKRDPAQGTGGAASAPSAAGAPPKREAADMFAFGKSEAELVRSIPGLTCGEAQMDIWGGADRSCLTQGEVIAGVGATIMFNLRKDRLVSAVLVIDQSDMRAMLNELTRRHGPPDGAVPSIVDPERVVWLTAKRALILDRTLPGLPRASSLLVSADESVLEQARTFLARARTNHSGALTAK